MLVEVFVLSVAVCLIFGLLTPSGLVFVVTVCSSLIMSLFFSLLFSMTMNNELLVFICLWIKCFIIYSAILVDIVALGVLFLWLFIVIGVCICLYSLLYMIDDYSGFEFLGFIVLFIVLMNELVLVSYFYTLLFCWEGCGLFSFYLIAFWSNRVHAVRSSLDAMLIGNVGDVGMLIAFSLLCSYGVMLFVESVFIESSFIYGCILLGGIVNSVTIVVHVWLPHAMEGPTPVSSLLHSATLVTLGLIVWILCSWLSEALVSLIGTLVGIISIWYFGIVVSANVDVKNVVAYSTGSQIALMMVGVMSDAIMTSILFIVLHAIFNCFVFLVFGVILHALYNSQDVRWYSGISNGYGLLCTMALLAFCSLLGLYVLLGFWSNECLFGWFSNVYVFECNILLGLLVLSIILSDWYVFLCIWYFNNNAERQISIDDACISFIFIGLLLCWILCIAGSWMYGLILGIGIDNSINVDGFWSMSSVSMLFILYGIVLVYIQIHQMRGVIIFGWVCSLVNNLYVELLVESIMIWGLSLSASVLLLEYWCVDLIMLLSWSIGLLSLIIDMYIVFSIVVLSMIIGLALIL